MITFLLKRAITETYKLKVKYKSSQMCKLVTSMRTLGFPGGSDDKESDCNAVDLGSIPGLKGYLEEGMATHSSILAWRIPWTEEPGRLQSMVSEKVGHD